MQTYSHFLITTVVNRLVKKQAVIPVYSRQFLAGSVAPDMPLLVLTVAFTVDRRLKKSDQVWCGDEFNALFFSDPRWIISHQLLHAPFLLLLLLVVGGWLGSLRGQAVGWKLLWFALGCAFHTAIDLGTHHDDGPLVFFPFDWKTRLHSPVSYWDARHGAKIFAPVEHAVDASLLVHLGNQKSPR